MHWFYEPPTGEFIAQSFLILSLVVASGLLVGKFKTRGVRLGVSGVRFTGLLWGHFGLQIDHREMEFVRESCLILFVDTTGMQVGPGTP